MFSHTDKQTALVVPPPVSTGDLSLARRLRADNQEIRKFFRTALANAIYLRQSQAPQTPPIALAAIESPIMPGEVVPLIARVTEGAVYVESDHNTRIQWTRDGRVPETVDFTRYARLLASRLADDTSPWTVLDARCSALLPSLDDLSDTSSDDARVTVEM